MGWSGSNSLVDDIKSNMVQLTENAEEMAIVAGLKIKRFSESHSVKQFACKIKEVNCLMGYTCTATPVDLDHELCCHITSTETARLEVIAIKALEHIGMLYWRLKT